MLHLNSSCALINEKNGFLTAPNLWLKTTTTFFLSLTSNQTLKNIMSSFLCDFDSKSIHCFNNFRFREISKKLKRIWTFSERRGSKIKKNTKIEKSWILSWTFTLQVSFEVAKNFLLKIPKKFSAFSIDIHISCRRSKTISRISCGILFAHYWFIGSFLKIKIIFLIFHLLCCL